MREGWEIRNLGEVCSFENGDRGKNYPSRTKFVKKGWPFVNAGHLQNKVIQFRKMNFISKETYNLLGRGKFSSGDLLFCLRGSLGKFAIVGTGEKGAIASSLIIVRPCNSTISEYIGYYFSSPTCKSMIEDYAGGTAQPNLGGKDLMKFQIPLPPLPEQKQIVAILDKAFAAIDQAMANTEKNTQNAKDLFQSKLNAIFSQTGKGWEVKTLGELGKVSMCKRILKKQTSPSGDIPFYKIGTFGKKPNAFIDSDIYQAYKSKYSYPKIGDILISASGTIGRRVIFDGKPAYFQDSNIVWIDNNEDIVLNEYLYHFYEVCNWNPSKGATISRLYNADLRKIKISYPKIAEQRKLIKKMLSLEIQTHDAQCHYQCKFDSLSELKKSILQKAFAGELTRKVGLPTNSF